MELTSPNPVSGALLDRQRPSAIPHQADATVPAVVEAAGADWLSLLELSQRLDEGRLAYHYIFKRWLDLALASLALAALAPLLLVVALIVRLDSPGPAIFRQTRIGRGGRPFVVFKIRTMRADREGPLRMFHDPSGRFRHKVPNDPRVTRVGRFLRRTSIDELPQLLNVLRGEMSLIGPRPELPGIVRDYQPWQHKRHLVRPGITGWWQTQGRSECMMHEHTELDIYYVEHLSLRLDARILVRTIKTVLSGMGAF